MTAVGKRLTGAAAGLATIGIAAWLCWFHRTPIVSELAAPARVNRVAPNFSRLPPAGAVKVCWIETGRFFGETGSALLIRHPRGDVLVDAGDSRHFSAELAGYPLGARLFMELVPGALRVRRALPEALRALGADPDHLALALLSHAHLDHLGGLLDLPPLPVLVPQPEIDFARANVDRFTINLVPVQLRWLLAHARPVPFAPRPYELFERSYDLYGDGSIVLVPLYGHTPGSMGIFVNLSPTVRLLHIGDTADDLDQVAHLYRKRWLLQSSDADPRRASAQVVRLHRLHQAVPSITILPAHDRAAWLRFFGAPGRCRD